MSRIGKIGRLPHELRMKVNERLQDCESGETILEWLNGLPEVREMLREHFEGAPINKQNLSEWRVGGHEEWVRHNEALETMYRFTGKADDILDAANEEPLSDRLALLLVVELAKTAEELLAQADGPEKRWERLRELLPQVAALRRADHRLEKLVMTRERFDRETEKWTRQKVMREFHEKQQLESIARTKSTTERTAKTRPPKAGSQDESNPVKLSQGKN
jgi:hypothetical protein